MRAKFATADPSVTAEGSEDVAEATLHLARAFVTKFEGFVVNKWNTDSEGRSARCKDLVSKLTADAKSIGLSNIHETVHPVLWAAVTSCLAT